MSEKKEFAIKTLATPKIPVDAQNAIRILMTVLLQENSMDAEIYDAFIKYRQNIPDVNEVLSGLDGIIEQGNDLALNTWLVLQEFIPTNMHEQDLLEKGDLFYQSEQYRQAIKVYEEILKRDSHKKLAQDRIKNSKSLIDATQVPSLPRDAFNAYKRAISAINGKDYKLAKKHLTEAVEISQNSKIDFTSARRLLNSLDEPILFVEFRDSALNSIKSNHWQDAIKELQSALLLNVDYEETKVLSDRLIMFYEIEKEVCLLENATNILSERIEKIRSLLTKLEETKSIYSPLQEFNYSLISRLENLADTATDQIEAKAKRLFEDASNHTTSLSKKKEFYEKVIASENTAKTINKTYLDPNFVSEAKNNIELIDRGLQEIKELKAKKKFPRGMSRENFQTLLFFAPQDPDILAIDLWNKKFIRFPKYGAGIFAIISLTLFLIAFFPGTIINSAIFIILGILSGLITLILFATYFFLLGQLL